MRSPPARTATAAPDDVRSAVRSGAPSRRLRSRPRSTRRPAAWAAKRDDRPGPGGCAAGRQSRRDRAARRVPRLRARGDRGRAGLDVDRGEGELVAIGSFELERGGGCRFGRGFGSLFEFDEGSLLSHQYPRRDSEAEGYPNISILACFRRFFHSPSGSADPAQVASAAPRYAESCGQPASKHLRP